MRFWKWCGALAAGLFVAGAAWFAVQVYRDYGLIRSGVPAPTSAGFSGRPGAVPSSSAAVDTVRLLSAHAPTQGAPGAPLTIVEFLDYDCPFCQATAQPLNEALNRYHDQTRLVIRDFPLESLHPRAFASALAARCAQDQGKYWPYHDALYLHQDQHEDADLKTLARNLGLDGGVFDACYDSQRFRSVILQDENDGLALGVAGTPTFFFNGVKVEGSLTRDQMEALIKRFLASLK